MPLESSHSKGTYPKVNLVGCGPGDPELLTIKAWRCIQKAEVILHDQLIHPEILALSPKAIKISVGKKAGVASISQTEIQEQLIYYARQNYSVVRLKSGDPFVFGRGGEEIEALTKANIHFEVIPGITAALGVAACYAIPLTHRDHAQSVQFVTAHLSREGQDLNWSSLAQAKQTLVFYMGFTRLKQIVEALLDHGKPETTKAALISQGTTPNQKILLAPLNEWVSIDVSNYQTPAIFIVSETLNYFLAFNHYNDGSTYDVKSQPINAFELMSSDQ